MSLLWFLQSEEWTHTTRSHDAKGVKSEGNGLLLLLPLLNLSFRASFEPLLNAAMAAAIVVIGARLQEQNFSYTTLRAMNMNDMIGHFNFITTLQNYT